MVVQVVLTHPLIWAAVAEVLAVLAETLLGLLVVLVVLVHTLFQLG
jgi:hypothetical protein